MSCQHCSPEETKEGVHHQPVATDPVCGMEVRMGAGKPSHAHDGEVYHFCSQRCHDSLAQGFSQQHRHGVANLLVLCILITPEPEPVREGLQPGRLSR